MQRLALACVVLSALVGGAFAQLTQTLPAGWDNTDPPGGGTSFPQNQTTDHIWQWHYDSSQFTAAFPILITEISVRADLPTATVGAFNFPSWEVTLIEASTDYQVGAHDPIFANNILTSSVVRTGPWTGGPVPPSGGATATWIPMGIQTPYFYDPTTGNDFIIQIRKCGTIATWGTSMDGSGAGVGLNGGNRYGDTSNCMATASTFNNNEFVPVVKIDFAPAMLPPVDMRMVSIDAPVSSPGSGCSPLTPSETVSVTVQNFGMNPVPANVPIPISYTFDDGINPPTVVNEMYTPAMALNQFDSDTYTFATTADLSAVGNYTFSATVSLPGDQDMSNDTVAGYTVTSGGSGTVSTFPYVENFDGSSSNGTPVPPMGWFQDPMDGGGTGGDLDWLFRNTGPTSNNGPAADHTTGVAGQGYFAYVEDSSGNHPAINLLTPCLDFGALSAPALTFWLHSNNSQAVPTNFENFISVDVIAFPGNIVFSDVIGPIGHLGNMWTFQSVDLSMFAGGTVRLRFRARSDGGSSTHDIAIDDVQILEQTPSNGQAPQPGVAEFDINNAATNGNGFPVSFGANGPYMITLNVGDLLTFSFSGEPFQIVVCFTGALNPNVLPAPPFGQVDVGMSDGMGGLTGVGVIGSGGIPGFPDSLFNTTGGTQNLTFGAIPPLFAGTSNAFQCFIFNTMTIGGLSNACVLNVN